MKRVAALLTCLLLNAGLLPAGGSREAAGSSTRGTYLAARGIIVPADQLRIDSYVAGIDYHYPKPAQGIGVTTYTGHHQVSVGGQDELIHVGIQGPATSFADLAPMNLAFVIDHSGSMGESDKLEWVKRAFGVFVENVRDRDFVSLVIFDSDAQVVFPSTQMNSAEKRARFQRAVDSLSPADGTNLLVGLKRGYEQVMTNFRSDFTNRVLFLTDGKDNEDHVRQIMDLVRGYAKNGINVSTIGVGTDFDLKLMTDIAAEGGGSSRFISDMKQMEQMFGSDLDRMVRASHLHKKDQRRPARCTGRPRPNHRNSL